MVLKGYVIVSWFGESKKWFGRVRIYGKIDQRPFWDTLMYDLPKNTMLGYASNPMFDKNDFGHLSVEVLAQEIGKYRQQHKNHVYPESDALGFYFLNHAFHVLKTKFNSFEPLPEDLVEIAEKHALLTNEISKRLFCYSTIIAVEEARFIPSQNEAFFELLTNSYGDKFADWVKEGFKGANLTGFKDLPLTMGEYTQGMVSVFAFGKWQPGFGGKGWVPIASLVADCVNGRISFESFADQAFSLCHNNGSMFNKGHMYHCYSPFIYKILDIQDSGQIPQWIGENISKKSSESKFITPELEKIYKTMAKHFPDEMTGKVDYSLIKDSETKRTKKQQAQAAKQQAMWNSYHGAPQKNQPPPKPVAKIDQILANDLKRGGFF